jgi:hypothetical protein
MQALFFGPYLAHIKRSNCIFKKSGISIILRFNVWNEIHYPPVNNFLILFFPTGLYDYVGQAYKW